MKKGFSLCILTILSVSAGEAADKSHLGQKIDKHVMLIGEFVPSGEGPCANASFDDKAFFQVFPDGTKSDSPFQFASGKLVITDVDWSVQRTVLGDPLIPGRTLRLTIFLGAGAPVFQSELTVDANSAGGRPGKSESATTGFVVAPGVAICPGAALADDSGFVAARIERIILRGYVIGD